jgi:ribonuclease PH
VSVGLVQGEAVLDLDYQEDSSADVDLNVVCASDGRLIEVQGAAERRPYSMDEFQRMLTLAQDGCNRIRTLQNQALGLDG